ncbi:MAG TPA: hypothetical protein VN681_12330 [Stellaceae bacterium]|nr:hypothetical protein [Stellaceae bacterium]
MSAGLRLLLDRIERSGRPPRLGRPPPLFLGWLLALAAASWAVLFVLGVLALLVLT